MTLQEFNEALERGPYAWPGGYPLYFVMTDGEALSFKAAQENAALIRCSIREGAEGWPDDGWRPAGIEVNWEDTSLTCAHTNAPIESAYGEGVANDA